MPTAPSPVATSTSPSAPPARRAVVLVGVVLVVLAALARFVFLALHPPVDAGIYDHHAMTEIRTTWWVTHLYLAGPGFPVAFGGFGALVVALASRTGRGLVPALVGAVLAGGGGLLSGLGFAAEGVTWGYLTDPAVVDPQAGASALRGIGEHPALIDVPVLGGFVLAGVGALLLAVALWRTGGVPRVLPGAGAAALVVAQAVPWPHALAVVPAVLDTTFLVVASVLVARRLLTRA